MARYRTRNYKNKHKCTLHKPTNTNCGTRCIRHTRPRKQQHPAAAAAAARLAARQARGQATIDGTANAGHLFDVALREAQERNFAIEGRPRHIVATTSITKGLDQGPNESAIASTDIDAVVGEVGTGVYTHVETHWRMTKPARSKH